MGRKKEITVVKLFKQLEALRVLMKLSIEDVAFQVGVTPLAYKNWKNHEIVPGSEREPDLVLIIERLERRHQRSLK